MVLLGILDNKRKGVVAPVGLPPVISLATKQLNIFSTAIIEARRLGAPVFRRIQPFLFPSLLFHLTPFQHGPAKPTIIYTREKRRSINIYSADSVAPLQIIIPKG